MGCIFEIEVNNKKEIFDIGNIARQASGSVMLREKNAVIIAAVAREDKPVEEDFLPLTVQYIEKAYAAGKMPGGYIKRETKPSDFETLTSRIIDRSLRPLFPKGYAYPTQITLFVVSSDPQVDLQVMALNAAAAALYVSDISVNKAVCGVRIGKIDGQLIINPSNIELKDSSLDLYVSGTKDELLMIEMRSVATKEAQNLSIPSLEPVADPSFAQSIIYSQNMNELSDEELIDALELAQKAISSATLAYEGAFKEIKKEDAALEYKAEKLNDSIYAYIEDFYKEDVYEAINKMAKSERAVELKNVAKKILSDDVAMSEGWEKDLVENVLGLYKRNVLRKMILSQKKRADGRGLKDVRQIDIKTNILPSVHGSCLFTRGQTQALVATTLGGDQDSQTFDLLNEKGSQKENFMVHYNFPGFSVGEASPLRAVGRRELGHGNLAKRALEPSIDLDYNMTIRIVSEILESNGSSSMATVCGGSLAMVCAGVPVQKLVAGVAMGLVTEGDEYAILTDIMGLEDHDGDMDFKVAGTVDGITAMQMDIKLGGISRELLKESLAQAKEARIHILNIMEQAKKEIQVNEAILPSVSNFLIDPSKIVNIIGQAGKTIREIIEKFEVSVDLDRDKGGVKIMGADSVKVKAACDHIKILASDSGSDRGGGRRGGGVGGERLERAPMPEFTKGDVVTGKVKKIVEFGAFVMLPGDVEGLLHISKVSDKRIDSVKEFFSEGDTIEVTILAQDKRKIELSFNKKL